MKALLKNAHVKNKVSSLPLLLTAFTLLGTINITVPAFAEPIIVKQDTCPARPQGNKIARTVMALAAAKNCANFPLSVEQIETKLQSLNCNAKTDKAITVMKAQLMPKMEPLYQGPRGAIMCQQAAKYDVSK